MGLHMPELIIVLVVALLIFGPKKLPEMGSAIGKSIKEFKKGVNEITAPKEPDFSLPESSVTTTHTKTEPEPEAHSETETHSENID
jgi:sec-independent protein translocase protein TatA